MPIGSYAAVPTLVERLLRCRPRSVLDLGMGFGGAGVLVRQWIDQGVRPWKTFLAGVEGWPEYRNPSWEFYNVVYAQRIEQFLDNDNAEFECVLLCDVIEHFSKDAGQQTLQRIQRLVKAGGRLIVTTPVVFFRQGAVHGNPLERHRSAWTAEDLAQSGFTVECLGEEHFHCGRCWFGEWQP